MRKRERHQTSVDKKEFERARESGGLQKIRIERERACESLHQRARERERERERARERRSEWKEKKEASD